MHLLSYLLSISLPSHLTTSLPSPPLSPSPLQVVSRDLHDPRGLAVDWAANNIYFSQRRDVDGHQGRIEVVSSDGRKRKVLFDTLNSVGSLAINILTG